MQIVVVEQDAALGLFLQKGLKLEGHEVGWVGDGEAALEYADAHNPDLMVLDLALPKKNGLEVLAEMHERHSRTAMLVLMAQNKVEDKVRCFDMGADDCVLKPFSFHELTARCRALLRRRARSIDAVLSHGDLALNRMERRVTRAGHHVELTAKEFGLLEFLLQRRGRCCNRSELLQEVFHIPPSAHTNVVDVYINYLRKKLAAPTGHEGPILIETVRGEGYRMANPAKATAAPAHYATALRSAHA